MDGVIIDSEPLYSSSETALLSKYGVKFNDNDWDFIKGCTESQFYDLVYSRFSPNIDRKVLIEKGREYLKKTFTNHLEYMDGFLDLYKKIKSNYQIALVTSTHIEMVNHIDSILDIQNKFDVIITAEDTLKHKPFPDPYQAAMKKLNLHPRECIVVEDSIQGIKSGQSAGSQVIALTGSFDKEELKMADYIISSLHDIVKYI